MQPKLCFALDIDNYEEGCWFVDELFDSVNVFKVGMQSFYASEGRIVDYIHRNKMTCMLDLKLHDIPETVKLATEKLICSYDPDYMTFHASGGTAMMRAARQCATDLNSLVHCLGVTVLTSLDEQDVSDLGFRHGTKMTTEQLASVAINNAGMHGLVCSPANVASLRQKYPNAFLVTPGIRFSDNDAGDQKRLDTPENAVRNGSNMLVVGRPIRDAKDKKQAAQRFLRAIEQTYEEMQG